MPEEFEKIIKFTPAYDKRSKDPKKDFGIHGVELQMFLKGSKGVIHFIVYTNWHLPHVQEEINAKLCSFYFPYLFHLPHPADIGYHSPIPMYEGQESITPKYEFLNGKPCYYDGYDLQAEAVFKILLKEGSNGVWEELERRYHSIFK